MRLATSDGASNTRKTSTKCSLRSAFVVKESPPCVLPPFSSYSLFSSLVPFLPRPSRGRLFEKTRPRVAQFTKTSQCPIAVCNLCQQARNVSSSRPVEATFWVIRIHHERKFKLSVSKQPNDLFPQTWIDATNPANVDKEIFLFLLRYRDRIIVLSLLLLVLLPCSSTTSHSRDREVKGEGE